RLTVVNRGPEAATLHVLPTLWYRNTWTWGCTHEGCEVKPRLARGDDGALDACHATLGRFRFEAGPDPVGKPPPWLLTENETNLQRCFGGANAGPFTKDAFHDYVIHGRCPEVLTQPTGTKAAAQYILDLPAGGEAVLGLRLCPTEESNRWPLGPASE